MTICSIDLGGVIMKHIGKGILIGALTLLLEGAPAFPHHSHEAEFYPDKKITLKGTITQVEWQNPHVYVHLGVKDNTGKVVDWALETYPPHVLHRGGVTKETFKEGQVVTVTANPAKDGTKNFAYLVGITFPDGHYLDVWLGDPKDYQQ
jgi:hypothetical protein